jgi:A/G-specific adenine glycosylase
VTEASLPDAEAVRLRARLLRWYRAHRRALPWRRSRDAYRVWLSEVMLQQTTVKAVVPYYERFLERYPSVAALAAAREEDVLGLWSGLGYYHRARNLLRGARHLVERHDGAFPKSLDAALAIPGVGLYTASAVLSIAHGLPLPVVDGNVRRVLARVFALRGTRWKKDGPFYNLAQQLLDEDAPGDFNQALMELGATICTPQKPACPACPIAARCQARALGLVERLPEGRARRATVRVTIAAALVEQAGRVLLVRRPEGRLLGRMWELPQTGLESRGRADLVRELRARHGLEIECGPAVARANHAITYRRLSLVGYRARLRRRPPQDPERFHWVRPDDLAELAVSSMTRKLLRSARSGQLALALD